MAAIALNIYVGTAVVEYLCYLEVPAPQSSP
jgi:hypothetical protein